MSVDNRPTDKMRKYETKYGDIWKETPVNEISHCKKCGNKFWVRWHNKYYFLDLCAPCYFKGGGK